MVEDGCCANTYINTFSKGYNRVGFFDNPIVAAAVRRDNGTIRAAGIGLIAWCGWKSKRANAPNIRLVDIYIERLATGVYKGSRIGQATDNNHFRIG